MSGTDREIRDAERAVIQAGRHLVGLGEVTRRDIKLMDVALQDLDALKSPLPSRDEMAESFPNDGWKEVERHGVFWLRWAARHRDILADGVPGPELNAWADELEKRK